MRNRQRGLRVSFSWQNLFTNGAIEFNGRFFGEHLSSSVRSLALAIDAIRVEQLQNSELPFLIGKTRDSAEVCSGFDDLAAVLLKRHLAEDAEFRGARHLRTDATFDRLPRASERCCSAVHRATSVCPLLKTGSGMLTPKAALVSVLSGSDVATLQPGNGEGLGNTKTFRSS